MSPWVRTFSYIAFSFLMFSCKKEHVNNQLVETEPPVLVAHQIKVNEVILGFYSALPSHYTEASLQYPLLIVIHGNGQVGHADAELESVLSSGIPKLIKDKLFPASFTVKGKKYSFLIFAPQFTQWPNTDDVVSFIDYVIRNYRVDTAKIYLSGLSMGGIITCDVGAEFSSRIAAIVPMSGVSLNPAIDEKCFKISTGKLPIWVFQNNEDEVFRVENARNFISKLKSYKPMIQPKFSEFLPFGTNGHDSWTRASDPNYREDNLNIYEWMLQYSR